MTGKENIKFIEITVGKNETALSVHTRMVKMCVEYDCVVRATVRGKTLELLPGSLIKAIRPWADPSLALAVECEADPDED